MPPGRRGPVGPQRPGGDEFACIGLPIDRIEEPRLADPGLSGEQQELAVAGHDVVQAAIDEVEQVVTPDEERATDHAKGG